MKDNRAPSTTRVLGVLNVTPDSFSDGGRYFSADAAIAHGRELVLAGADIIDVGGESTRPGAQSIDEREELRRVLPVVEALAADGITVSIDTMRAATARAAVSAGASIVNDVSGGRHDSEMRRTVADLGVTYIAMHWRGIPDAAHRRSRYSDVVTEVRDGLGRIADEAIAAGIAPEHLVLDPGLGFDKTAKHGWQLLAGLPQLAELGYPVMVGVSRKRMITATLTAAAELRAQSQTRSRAHPPTVEMPVAAEILVTTEDRDIATAVVSALAAGVGAWGVRVHNVAATVQALAIAEAWNAASASQPAKDRITLTGLEVFAHHGVFEFERERGQRFLIDVDVTVDLRDAAKGDALAKTVNYGDLASAVVAAVERDPVDLIETVAERVAQVALGFAGVTVTRVTVHKPDAPIDADFEDVSVTVVRRAGVGSS